MAFTSRCPGGALLAAGLAWMAEKGDDRIATATYLATMVDWANRTCPSMRWMDGGLPRDRLAHWAVLRGWNSEKSL